MKIDITKTALGSFQTVEGIRYTVEKSGVGDGVCWQGGELGGTIFINFTNRSTGLVDETHPYKTYSPNGGSSYGTSHRTIVKAALYAQKQARRAYEEAKARVARYEAALAAQKQEA